MGLLGPSGSGTTTLLVTTARVLRQLRHDRRTIELVIVLPCLLLSIVAWMFSGTPMLDHWGPMLVGFTTWVLGMDVAGALGLVVLVAVLDAGLGSALGLGASALARTEFMQQLALGAAWAGVRGAIGAIALFVVGAIVLGVVTLRRRTP